MKYLVIAFFLLLACSVSQGQSIETGLQWSVNRFINKTTNEDISHACRFESDQTSIRWIQKGGALIYEFTITAKSGTWTDVSSNGEITFQVTFRGAPGTVRFVRSNGQLFIEPIVSTNGRNIMPYAFMVSSVTEK